jgi:hypothetical protein
MIGSAPGVPAGAGLGGFAVGLGAPATGPIGPVLVFNGDGDGRGACNGWAGGGGRWERVGCGWGGRGCPGAERGAANTDSKPRGELTGFSSAPGSWGRCCSLCWNGGDAEGGATVVGGNCGADSFSPSLDGWPGSGEGRAAWFGGNGPCACPVDVVETTAAEGEAVVVTVAAAVVVDVDVDAFVAFGGGITPLGGPYCNIGRAVGLGFGRGLGSFTPYIVASNTCGSTVMVTGPIFTIVSFAGLFTSSFAAPFRLLGFAQYFSNMPSSIHF